jgi:hypothetical protein
MVLLQLNSRVCQVQLGTRTVYDACACPFAFTLYRSKLYVHLLRYGAERAKGKKNRNKNKQIK